MESALINYLQQLRPIPESDKQLIVSSFEKMSFKQGKYLIKAGKASRYLFFICKGILKFLIPNSAGKEITYFFLREQQFITLLNSNGLENPAEQGIQAITDVDVLAINKSKLNSLIKQLPYFQDLLNQIAQQSVLDKIFARNAYFGYDSEKRYKIFLEKESEIALKVAPSDIASYLGITPQSLTRLRKNMR